MKKIMIILGIILTITTSVIIVNNLNNGDNNNTINSNKKIAKNNFYTILLETDVGSGEYIESTSDEWPSDDYVLNKKLSGCKNGSELSFDEENKIIYVSAVSNDSCYVYFSKGILFSDYIKDLYTTDGANDLYLHDGIGNYGILEAGDNSYRYTGSNPSNYVCFGTDASSCPVDNLYRIIGVFEDNVKLIKYDYGNVEELGNNVDYQGSSRTPNSDYYNGALSRVPEYYWNNDNYNNTYNSAGYYNVWKYSALNTNNLNYLYINTFEQLWIDKIKLAQWQIGGVPNSVGTTTVKNVFDYELGDNRINTSPFEVINTKIGLIYISDYGYASSPNYWTTDLEDYRANSNALHNNWLYIGFGDWTITRVSDNNNSSYYIGTQGGVSPGNVSVDKNGIRPTFYLNDNVTYVSGDGSIDNPYRIN